MLDTFGWDLLLDGVKHEITKKSELLVVFIHWILISNGAKCLGCENKFELENNEKQFGTELLPEEWNLSPDKYTLRYIFKDRLFILYGLDCGEIFLFNWLNVFLKHSTSVAINVDLTVKSLSGPLHVVINDWQEEINNINKNLLEFVYDYKTRNKENQTQKMLLIEFDPYDDLTFMP